MIGSFGDIIFEVSDSKVQTFSNFSRSVGANYSSHQLINGKARSEFTSPKLQTVSFNMQFNSQFGTKPRNMLDKLAEMAEKGQVFFLIIGGKPIGKNRWKITSLSESWDKIYTRGELSSATVSVQMEEYL